MKITAPAMYRVGDDTLFTLFDTGEMDHVCELVRERHDPELGKDLRRLLLVPIDQFIARLYETGRGVNAEEYPAADKFRDKVDSVAAYCEGGQMDTYTAGVLADGLERAWLRFIARAGAHRIYDDLPRTLARDKNRREVNAINAKEGGKARAANIARPELDKLIRACLARGEKTKTYVKTWANDYGVSRQTVYNAIRRIKKETPK